MANTVLNFFFEAEDPGTPGANEVLGLWCYPLNITFPANMSTSTLVFAPVYGIHPAADYTIAIYLNTTQKATLIIHTDGSATYSTVGNAPWTANAGDIITMAGPYTPDTQINGFFGYLLGTS